MRKSAFLGCGARARAHARAYAFVEKGKPAAACDLDEERLGKFADEFGLAHRYTDIHEMIEKEKPDLLHIVTAPTRRVPLMTIASEHAVPVALVEKPIALQGEDWRALTQLEQTTKTKFIVNTQLHFHARNLEFKRDVAEGRIGEVRFIDISCASTMPDQGVHILELAHSYNGFSSPTRVFAAVAGADALSATAPSPDTAQAAIAFENGVRAQMTTGPYAPRIPGRESVYHHKRIAVHGTEGFVHWTMVGWERFTRSGGYERGEHDYTEEDDKAQARLTDSAFDLRADPSIPHGTRLALALRQFNVILGAYMSALERRPVELPCAPSDGLLDALRAALG
ncbi:MAG: Gfo/Idh/MocA family oxidoreductase [Kiritimatiellae bacterium]|nr:Gfo/Idh/MocA family oxidoreductase [Kiritimatiellia bacterium]